MDFTGALAPAVAVVHGLGRQDGGARAEGDEYAQAYSASRAFAIDHGALESHAYDQFDTLAGQGTLAREWLEQSPRLDVLLVAVGRGPATAGLGWMPRSRSALSSE